MGFSIRLALLVAVFVGAAQAYSVHPNTNDSSSRRALFEKVAAVAAGGALSTFASPSPALASGGATAGKYT